MARNGIFDEIEQRKPRRRVVIRYSSVDLLSFAVAGILGFVILFTFVAALAGLCGCGRSCGGTGVQPRRQQIDDSALRHTPSTDGQPMANLISQMDNIRRAVDRVKGKMTDIETRLARDERMLETTTSNVEALTAGEQRATNNASAYEKRAQEALTEHVGQMNATDQVLRDIRSAMLEEVN